MVRTAYLWMRQASNASPLYLKQHSSTKWFPNSLGPILYSNCVLGTMEMHWMLASFIRKVFSPCDCWSQALMTNQLSSSSSSMHLGNKYPSHAYLSSFQPCVGCLLAWKLLWAIVVVLAYFLHLVYLGDICDESAKTFSSIDIISLWYLLPNSKHLHYLLFP